MGLQSNFMATCFKPLNLRVLLWKTSYLLLYELFGYLRVTTDQLAQRHWADVVDD